MPTIFFNPTIRDIYIMDYIQWPHMLLARIPVQGTNFILIRPKVWSCL